MLHLVRLISLRRLRKAPAPTLRAAAAVMVAVGTMVGVQLISRSISRGVEDSLNTFSGRTALRIEAGETGLPESVLDGVREVPGVESATPILQAPAYAVGTAGEFLTVLGVDVIEEQRVRRYAASTDGEEVAPDPFVLLSHANSIILTRTYAERHGLKLDDRIELRLPVGRRSFVIRGLLKDEGPVLAFGGNLAVMDYMAAQVAFAKEGRLDQIDVVARPGMSVDVLAAALRTAVGPGVRVEPPGARAAEIALATRSVSFVFWLLSAFTVIVAMFLLYNAVSMTIAQRGQEIALMRALGVRRAEIVRLFLLEAGVIGLLGALPGIVFGFVIARLMLQPVTTTMSTALFVPFRPTEIASIGYTNMLGATVLGVMTTLLAAWLPARQVARFVPAAAASRGAVIALRQARLPPAWCGALCMALGALLAGGALVLGVRMIGPAADASFVIGFALLAPAVVRSVLPAITRLVHPLGAVGRLAVLNVARNLQRSTLTAFPLMVAIALVVVIATMVQSFRVSIDSWIAGLVQADFQIASVSQEPGRGVLMPEALVQGMAAIPGVAEVRRHRQIHANYEGRRIGIEYTDYDPNDPTRCCVRFRQGDPPSAFAKLAAGEAVVVSENFAQNFGVGPGNVVKLSTPQGVRALPIVATTTNYNADQGSIMMAGRLFVPLFGDGRADQVMVRIEPDADPAAVRTAIAARYGEEYQLIIFTSAELRRDIRARVDRAFLPASSLLVFAIVVGCLGIANSLHVAITERVREIGILRSVGARRREIARLIVTEAGVLGLLGAFLGLALGVLLSYIWVVIHVRHFLGWVLEYHFALAGSLSGVGAALVTAPLAGWWPARRAALLQPVQALAHE